MFEGGFTLEAAEAVAKDDAIASPVIDVLSRVGAQWSLVGAHAVNVYVEPRATVDIDFVVEARKMKPILRALEEEFGVSVPEEELEGIATVGQAYELVTSKL
ncbi:MAG: hypothetical protein HC868_15145 [Sphingomonadales bacterium]|nr:hypothetical protein [Sphingomonadales bacterium]